MRRDVEPRGAVCFNQQYSEAARLFSYVVAGAVSGGEGGRIWGLEDAGSVDNDCLGSRFICHSAREGECGDD
jgi:hypothetical protein